METTEFYGERLRAARLLREQTLEETGAAVGVTKGYIKQLESGRKPTEDIVLGLASALRVSRTFFARPATEGFSPDEYHFRKQRTTPAKVWEAMAANGLVLIDLIKLFESELRLEENRIPSWKVQTPEDAEEIADRLRASWDLGRDVPVTNMTRVIETIGGGVVTRFRANMAKIDALSRPGVRGTVICNSDKVSTSRARFNLAHELGHLVMHRGDKPGLEENERAADIFAGSFLLPAEGFLREFPRQERLHWPLVFRMKQRWKASCGAILYRARQLGRLNEAEYHRAYKYMSAQGWVRAEPEEPAEEPVETIPTCFAKLRRRGIGAAEISRSLGVGVEDLEKITSLDLGERLGDNQGTPARVLRFERRSVKTEA